MMTFDDLVKARWQLAAQGYLRDSGSRDVNGHIIWVITEKGKAWGRSQHPERAGAIPMMTPAMTRILQIEQLAHRLLATTTKAEQEAVLADQSEDLIAGVMDLLRERQREQRLHIFDGRLPRRANLSLAGLLLVTNSNDPANARYLVPLPNAEDESDANMYADCAYGVICDRFDPAITQAEAFLVWEQTLIDSRRRLCDPEYEAMYCAMTEDDLRAARN
jgi:hypothetical protein